MQVRKSLRKDKTTGAGFQLINWLISISSHIEKVQSYKSSIFVVSYLFLISSNFIVKEV